MANLFDANLNQDQQRSRNNYTIIALVMNIHNSLLIANNIVHISDLDYAMVLIVITIYYECE
jgi:hypothetical protein